MKASDEERSTRETLSARGQNHTPVGPKRAEVILRQGRQHLFVRGIVVATEGDLCRSPDLPRMWTPDMLRRVAALINDEEAPEVQA